MMRFLKISLCGAGLLAAVWFYGIKHVSESFLVTLVDDSYSWGEAFGITIAIKEYTFSNIFTLSSAFESIFENDFWTVSSIDLEGKAVFLNMPRNWCFA
jgi:hypothetical protein